MFRPDFVRFSRGFENPHLQNSEKLNPIKICWEMKEEVFIGQKFLKRDTLPWQRPYIIPFAVFPTWQFCSKFIKAVVTCWKSEITLVSLEEDARFRLKNNVTTLKCVDPKLTHVSILGPHTVYQIQNLRQVNSALLAT